LVYIARHAGLARIRVRLFEKIVLNKQEEEEERETNKLSDQTK